MGGTPGSAPLHHIRIMSSCHSRQQASSLPRPITEPATRLDEKGGKEPKLCSRAASLRKSPSRMLRTLSQVLRLHSESMTIIGGLPSCCTWQAFGDEEAGAVAHAVQQGVVLQQRRAAGGPVQEAVQEADGRDGRHVPLQARQHHQLHVLYEPGLKRPLPGRCHLSQPRFLSDSLYQVRWRHAGYPSSLRSHNMHLDSPT